MSKLPTMTADEINRIREKLDKKQREMADLLGVDLRTYQRWEANERNIPGPAVLLVRRIVNDHEKVIEKK
jgi:DNA-binding transcriptional regulator YiaG